MKINVEDGLIEAKSVHENAIKEIVGAKPVTVRIVSDMKAGQLRAMEAAAIDEAQALTIAITDVETKQTIRRQVTDITLDGPILGQWIAIISWRHMPGLEGEE